MDRGGFGSVTNITKHSMNVQQFLEHSNKAEKKMSTKQIQNREQLNYKDMERDISNNLMNFDAEEEQALYGADSHGNK
jgi:hypothetical protein